MDKHLLVLERLVAAFRKNKKFEQIYKDFELQRVCYLPLTSFIIKPLQRLMHYNDLLGRKYFCRVENFLKYEKCFNEIFNCRLNEALWPRSYGL